MVAKMCCSLVLMGEVTASASPQALARVFAALSASLAVVDWGSAGLALASSLAATVNLLFQAGVLYRRLGVFPWAAWASSLGWSVSASVAMAVPLCTFWMPPLTSVAIAQALKDAFWVPPPAMVLPLSVPPLDTFSTPPDSTRLRLATPPL